ncbi:ABC transporter permease [Bowmanella denitrificans]|uniref:ABC transporter permease n=1 Tax=Bowmanella denitrificans TaxID=366582 RepID=A0ABN0WQS0_9ALTE
MSYAIEIKYAARLLLSKPLFSVTAMLIVAVGLGLTIYTLLLLNQLIFKPMTLSAGTPLVAIEGEFHTSHGRGQRADIYHLNQISADSQLLQGMSQYRPGVQTIAGVGEQGNAKMLSAAHSQWNLFEVLGIQPVLGRGFGPQDQDQGAPPVSVISHALWQGHFAADPQIIGKAVRIDGQSRTIIGVMPAGFAFPATAQIWQPIPLTRLSPSEPSTAYADSLYAVARLKPDVSLAQFQQELKHILQRHFQALPAELAWRAASPGGHIRAFPFKLSHDSIAQHYAVFMAMLVVVLLILLLTGINVGNLLLVRVNERIKEVAIRISLGVPRKRLIVQMLLESTLICALGGLVALALASGGVHLTNLVFEEIFAVTQQRPFWWYVQLDLEAVLLLLAMLVVMVIITGLIPALRALSGDVNALLRDGTRGALSKRAQWTNKALVVAEISLSCVVLSVATMLLSTSYASQQADYGVTTDKRITADIVLPSGTYPWQAGDLESKLKRNHFYYRLKDELEALPHIHSAAYFTSPPGTGGGVSHFEIRGRAAQVYNENPQWNFETVSRDAWHTVGITLIDGRSFTLDDAAIERIEAGEQTAPAVINAAIARDLFPDGDAIGQQVRTVTEDWHSEWRTIIGVVSDTVHGPTMQATSARHTGYGLMELRPWLMTIVIHYSGPQGQAEAMLRQAINRIDADVTPHNVQSYDNLVKQPMKLVDAVNRIFLLAGLVALVLAGSGIYAVSANTIMLQSQEIATRRALGARNGQIVALFLKQAAGQLLLGVSAGLLISLWLVGQITQSIVLLGNSYLMGLLGIPAFIAILVLLATYLPTRKLLHKEPAAALHQV